MKLCRFTVWLSCLIASAQISFAQLTNIIWQNTLGNGNTASLVKIIPDKRGDGYLLSGSSFPGVHGAGDAWLVKIDTSGDTVWSQYYGGSNTDGFIVKSASSGGYICIGNTKSSDGDISQSNKGGLDIWALRTDDAGNILWSKTFGGSKDDAAYDFTETDDGGFIIAAQTASNDGDVTNLKGDIDAWILKINSNGSLVWQKSYGSSSYDMPRKIKKTSDGNYIILAESAGADSDVLKNNGAIDIWLFKINNTGTILWQAIYGGSNGDLPGDIVETKQGYTISAYSGSNDKDFQINYGKQDGWLIKTDDTGKLLWKKHYGGTETDEFTTLTASAEGGYLVGGSSFSNDGDFIGAGCHGGAYGDALIMKIDDTGRVVWQHMYGGTMGEAIDDLIQLTDSNYLFIGPVNSNNGDVTKYYGTTAPWLVKIGKYAPTFPTAIKKTAMPQLKIYPTITTGTINILSEDLQDAQINITDVLGKQINTTTLKTETGYRIQISNIPEGIYILNILNPIITYTSKIYYQQ